MHARAQARGGPDFFGEEHLLKQLQHFLETLGVEDAEIVALVDRLTLANNLLEPTPVASISELGTVTSAQPEAQASAGSGEAVMVADSSLVAAAAAEDDFDLGEADEELEGPPNPDIIEAELAKAGAAEEEPEDLPTASLQPCPTTRPQERMTNTTDGLAANSVSLPAAASAATSDGAESRSGRVSERVSLPFEVAV